MNPFPVIRSQSIDVDEPYDNSPNRVLKPRKMSIRGGSQSVMTLNKQTVIGKGLSPV